MSKVKEKNQSISKLVGIALLSFSLLASAFIFSTQTAKASFLDDWLCRLFGECGGGQQVPQPGPAPAQPQPQPQPTPQPQPSSSPQASDESSGLGGEDYGIVSRNICQAEGGRVENDWGLRSGEVGCVFPYKEPVSCNYNGNCDDAAGEDVDNCFSDCRPQREDVKPAPGVAQLGDVACGCTSRGYVWSCNGYAFYPNACNTATRCSEDVDNRCAPSVPFAPGVDGTGGTSGTGGTGTGGEGSGGDIFGPGGFFGPGGGTGGASGAGGPGGSGGGRPQCSDGIDNDNDGKTDRADPGCLNPIYDPNDNSEFNFKLKEVIPDFFNLNWFKFNFVNLFGARAFS